MRYIFLTEEESMKVFLNTLFERFSPNFEWFVVSHRSKTDLTRHGIGAAFRRYANVDATFIVLIDRDLNNCLELKEAVVEKCREVCRQLRQDKPFKVRVVCNELESWYFGDLPAVDAAFGTKLFKQAGQEIFRNPENWGRRI